MKRWADRKLLVRGSAQERKTTNPTTTETWLARPSQEVVESGLLGLRLPLTDGSVATIGELANRFYQSRFGKAMEFDPLRYSSAHRLPYDRDLAQTDSGLDLNPIGHMQDLSSLVKVINGTLTDHQNNQHQRVKDVVSKDSLAILGLTCLIHDLGESQHPVIQESGLTTVGDIASGQKTAENKRHEQQVRQFLYERLWSDLDQTALSRIEGIIAHQPCQGDELLHDIYETAHSLQSLETARRSLARASLLRAFIDPKENRINALSWFEKPKRDHIKLLREFYRRLGFSAINDLLVDRSITSPALDEINHSSLA